jgi:hypothetical protein
MAEPTFEPVAIATNAGVAPRVPTALTDPTGEVGSIYTTRTAHWEGLPFSSITKVIDLTDEARLIDLTDDTPFVAGYHRTAEELRALEERILSYVPADAVAESGLVFVEMSGLSAVSDWFRTSEMNLGWGDMPVWMTGYEHVTRCFAVCDFHADGGPAIVRGFRLGIGALGAGTTGSQVVDSLLGQVTLDEVRAFHQIDDVRACWDVSSFFTVPGRKRTDRHPFGYAPYAYLGIFRRALQCNVPVGFSYTNRLTDESLAKNLIPQVPLAGRDLRAPTIEGYEYNADMKAFVLSAFDGGEMLFDPGHEYSAMIASFRNTPMAHVLIRTE